MSSNDLNQQQMLSSNRNLQPLTSLNHYSLFTFCICISGGKHTEKLITLQKWRPVLTQHMSGMQLKSRTKSVSSQGE